MKKILFVTISVIAFSSCSNKECQYSKMQKLTYNLNKEAKMLVVGNDSYTGCYSITKTANEAELKDSEKDFSIKITTNPNMFYISDDGSKHEFGEKDGFTLGNSMSGDTLILHYLPTDKMPDDILKFGMVYKFYN